MTFQHSNCSNMQPVATELPTAEPATPDRRTVVRALSRLRSAEGQADPFPVYAELRALGDVVPAPWGAYFVTRFRTVNHVLRDPAWGALDEEWRAGQGSSSRWANPAAHEIARTLTALNPPEHTRQRRSIGNIFDRPTVAAMRPHVRRTAGQLVDDFLHAARNDGVADFSEMVSERLPAMALSEWLGLPKEGSEQVQALTHRYMYAQELLPTERQTADAGTAAAELREYFEGLVAERRRRPGADLVSSWLRTWDALALGDRAKADEVVSCLANFIATASLETASTLLSTTVWSMLRHPEQLALAAADRARVPDAVEEVLRYDPSIHVVSRVAREDTILSGVRIAKGQLVHTLPACANHDPTMTPDADRFDISRRGRNVSFGGGFHYCVGASFARLEAACVLEALLERRAPLRLDGADAVRWEPRLAFRRMLELRLAWAPDGDGGAARQGPESTRGSRVEPLPDRCGFGSPVTSQACTSASVSFSPCGPSRTS
ncbi:cytochrome P450 [Yinghuangia aomiensis]|uniref:Cytochrome P450 n=1 Tax=Yinghuangia aomiensis TaxID=676205 RepID=A0ABP9HTY8_9ACTN